MKSLYNFIIRPYLNRYTNTATVEDTNLIVNTSIENHSFVSKQAVVVATPASFDTDIKPNDKIYVHHNLFRRWYDMKGKERNSSTHFKDDLYFCSLDQIYMYNNKCHLDYCFVKPILNKSSLSTNKEQDHFGILKYGNSSLDAVGVTPGTLVVFTPDSEFEFIIEGERLYCMKSNDIAVTHEYEGNEEENNPSWAESC
jgi:hypothetical protein